LVDWSIEVGLQIAMSAKRFTNVPCPSVLGVQLNRLEIVYVIWTGLRVRYLVMNTSCI
jgi:hypothetical protein